MRIATRFAIGALAVGALVIASAEALSAQELVRNQGLDRMHDDAMAPAFAGVPGGIERAAWRHAHVAYTRGEDDVRRFECLRTQAELFEAIGEVDGARFYLVQAARQAETQGAPYDAAMTYIDAAILAQHMGDALEARELAAQARAQFDSPVLDVAQRAEILERLEPGF